MDFNNNAVHTSICNRAILRLIRFAHRLHVPGWLFDYGVTWLMEIPLLVSPESPISPCYTVRPAGIQDLPALANYRQMDDLLSGVALFRTRFERGARCCIILDPDNHVVGYAWVMCTGNLFEDDDRYRITCRSDGAYIFDTFLLPDARGKGLYAFLIAGLQQHMGAFGKTEFHVLVDQSNTLSYQAHRKLGAKVCETSIYTTFLGISWYLLKTATRRRICLRRYHTSNPCDSLVLKPLDSRSFSLSITSIEQESTMIAALERIKPCEGQNFETSTPFNVGEIAYIWWRSDIRNRESLFLIEVLQSRPGLEPRTVAYGFFRLHEGSRRFLHPRELIAFDDVYFMNTTLLIRTSTMQATDMRQILALPGSIRQIQQTTGADVVIWHRLPPCELSSLPYAMISRWKSTFETEYPLLDGLSTVSPLESDAAKHALRDLTKQSKRLKNAYQSKPETTCLVLGGLDEEQQQVALHKFITTLNASWQHEWMEKSDRVDYQKFLQKLLAYTNVWIKQGYVRLYITQVAGMDMAYLYTLQRGRTCWCIMTGFNPLLKTYSPGKTVFVDMLKQSWDTGIREYHLGGNVLGWKEPWLTRCLRLYSLELWLDTGKALVHRIKLLVRR